ncbi:ABC transporter permease [Haladaptatus halobius]|uniref:ABC transporter permease n=1 Tax=Haladaptatus halobius TaxID=2884875 RepID=UPI001D0A22A7|nr:ABC transporter permease [Haladaptatus halobius]
MRIADVGEYFQRFPVPKSAVLQDIWTNFERWNLKAIRNPFTLTISLVMPIIWLAGYTQVFKSLTLLPGFPAESYLAFFSPAVIIVMAMFAAATSGMGLVDDMDTGIFNKQLVSPMNRSAMVVGKICSEALRLAVQVLFLLALAMVLGAHVVTGLGGIVAIVLIAELFSFVFVAFSNIVGLVTHRSDATALVSNFITLPLVFLSSSFVPRSLLPTWIQTISTFNPVTYGVTAIRVLMLDGWVWTTIGPAVVVLVVFDLVLGGIAVVLLRRATDSETTLGVGGHR